MVFGTQQNIKSKCETNTCLISCLGGRLLYCRKLTIPNTWAWACLLTTILITFVHEINYSLGLLFHFGNYFPLKV